MSTFRSEKSQSEGPAKRDHQILHAGETQSLEHARCQQCQTTRSSSAVCSNGTPTPVLLQVDHRSSRSAIGQNANRSRSRSAIGQKANRSKSRSAKGQKANRSGSRSAKGQNANRSRREGSCEEIEELVERTERREGFTGRNGDECSSQTRSDE